MTRTSRKPKKRFTPVMVRMVDAPQVLGLSRNTLYRMVNAGVIQLYKQGSCSLLDPQEVKAAIKSSIS